MTKLSILDQAPMRLDGEAGHALDDTLRLSQHADALGFERYWIAEHHAMDCVAATAPEVMIANVAAVTGQIRVGSGGVLLPNHRPLHVAEQFRTLESLHPGRIDLGIGRSEGALDDAVVMALARSADIGHGAGFDEQLDELLSFGGVRQLPADHPLATVRAMPDDVPLPPVYLLGSSTPSAETAAANGFGYAFAYLINPDGAAAALQHYRKRFISHDGVQPYAILALRVYVAENDARARAVAAPGRLASARNRAGRSARLLPIADAVRHEWDEIELAAGRRMRQEADIIGDPESVYARITELANSTHADEIMVLINTHDPDDRKIAYGLLAEMFVLRPRQYARTERSQERPAVQGSWPPTPLNGRPGTSTQPIGESVPERTNLTPPRIPPLAVSEWNSEVQAVLAKWRGSGAGTGDMPRIWATLAHHPKLLAAWEPFARTILLGGFLPARERELIVMRTALNCRASYIWGQHIADHGPESGVTEEEVAMVIDGPGAGGWDPFDAALIAAADQLHYDGRIDDATWATLASRYDERQLIEVNMLVGEYHLMAFTLNSLGVQNEDGIPGLPEGWSQ